MVIAKFYRLRPQKATRNLIPRRCPINTLWQNLPEIVANKSNHPKTKSRRDRIGRDFAFKKNIKRV